MFLAGLIACAITGILILVRIILGKTTFDRVLAVNSLGTIIVIGIQIRYGGFLPECLILKNCLIKAPTNIINEIIIQEYSVA